MDSPSNDMCFPSNSQSNAASNVPSNSSNGIFELKIASCVTE